MLVVEVSDDGPGGADPQGGGLTGLRHRVEALDGTLTVTSPAGRRDHDPGGAAMRVVIAEDQALLREGIVALLREDGIDVVAQAEDGPGLLRDHRRPQARPRDRRRAAPADVHRRGRARGDRGARAPPRASAS